MSDSGPSPPGAQSALSQLLPQGDQGKDRTLQGRCGCQQVESDSWLENTGDSSFEPNSLGHSCALCVPSKNKAVFSEGRDETLTFAALKIFGMLESGQALGVPKA